MKNFMKSVTAFLAIAIATSWSAPTLADTVTYFHNDLVGSPMAATNQAGQVVWRETYRPYGDRQRLEPASSANEIWFTSRKEDPRTELIYMGARYYDPRIGRFLQPDPVGFVEANIHSFNRYAYANNNPYRYKDPDGQESVGTLIDAGANKCGAVSCAGWALLSATWKVLGAEAVSQVADKGWGSVKDEDKIGAGIEMAGALPFLKLGTGGKQLAKQLASEEGVGELLSGGGRAIMGSGTKVELKEGARLADEYGGSVGDWAKVTSTGKGEGRIQTHGYRNVTTRETVELKSIVAP